MSRIMPFLSSLLASLLLLAGPTAPLAQEPPIDKAKKEGEVVWYTSMGVAENRLIAEAFEKKYSFLKVKAVRANNEQILERSVSEQRAGKHLFDVISTGAFEIHLLKKRGLFAPMEAADIKQFLPGGYDPDRYWVDLYALVNVVAYNTRLVPTERIPKAWEDLLRPYWKGKIGFREAYYAWFAAMLDEMGEDRGRKFMKALSEQELSYQRSQNMITQLVAAGEYDLGFVFENQALRYRKDGAPIEVAPLPFGIKEGRPLAIAKSAPHPSTARLFAEHCLSKDIQAILQDQGRTVSRRDVFKDRLRGMKLVSADPRKAEIAKEIFEDYKKYFLR